MGWPYQQKPPMGWPLDYNSGLVPNAGFWPMLEGSGNKVFDLSGNGNSLALTGSWANGGAKIDADADRLLAANSVLSQTEGTFICCLNRFASWPQNGALFNIENATNNLANEMLFNNQFNLIFLPNCDESSADYWNFDATPDNLFTLNTDYVVAVVWKNGSILKGYINGIEVGSLHGDISWIASTFAADAQLSIGNTYAVDYETNCIYKWAYGYSLALSASEIALLYREPFCMFERMPIELWSAAAQGGGAPPAGIPIFRRRRAG